jgi:hypothetical protein
VVQSQPGKIICETVSRKYPTHTHKKADGSSDRAKKIFLGKKNISQTQWCTPIVLAIQEARQEDYKFKASLGNTVRPCFQKKKSK